MKSGHFAVPSLRSLALFLAATGFFSMASFSIPRAAAQASPDQPGVPVSMVVTVKGHHGAEANVSGENVIVTESKARAKVTEWVPLQGDRAGLELFILLDDSRDTSLGTQVEDIRRFIRAQPSTTKIGVAYMQEGGTKIVQPLTEDHAKAASALHVSLGNLARSDSPYNALSDLIKQWPAGTGPSGNDRRGADRREVLMISTGVDPVNGDSGPYRYDGYVETAIEAAQRAGVVVFAIGTFGEDIVSDHTGAGRNYLAQVAEETGGESYHLQSGSLTSFAPYLEDATQRLNRQYLLTFLAKAGKKAGMQPVKVRTDVSHAELASAEKVYVPAAQ